MPARGTRRKSSRAARHFLDARAPIGAGGKMVGVVRHEQTSAPREWTLDEQSFAGSIADLVALSFEVCRRRQAEAALRDARDGLERKVDERTRDLAEANERLQELDRLKSEFLATMSHELRTPLNSIIGFTGILRQELAGPVNDEQKKQLGMVQSAGRICSGSSMICSTSHALSRGDCRSRASGSKSPASSRKSPRAWRRSSRKNGCALRRSSRIPRWSCAATERSASRFFSTSPTTP